MSVVIEVLHVMADVAAVASAAHELAHRDQKKRGKAAGRQLAMISLFHRLFNNGATPINRHTSSVYRYDHRTPKSHYAELMDQPAGAA